VIQIVRTVVRSVEAEFRRYKALGEGAIDQLSDAELCAAGPAGESSLAVIVWHISGNLKSRFTDFLETDGEKSWRNRESEFEKRSVTLAELRRKWEDGWNTLFGALETLSDAQLSEEVAIRGESFTVCEALHRALAHISYHVGQMVSRAKAVRGDEWRYLSIPPGGSDAYNQNPTREHAPGSRAGRSKSKSQRERSA